MSYSKPIWHAVEACIYQAVKSYGAKDTSKSKVLVGSSKSNSHQLAEVVTTRRFEEHKKYGSICIFKHSVDGVILKEMIFHENDGKAGKFIKERTALKRVKGL
jgi:hypothetical protein